MDYTACDGVPRFRNKPGAELVNRFKLLCLMRANHVVVFFSFRESLEFDGSSGDNHLTSLQARPH